jgi:hypothetical protein
MPGFKLFELPLFASASLLVLDTVGITNEDMSDSIGFPPAASALQILNNNVSQKTNEKNILENVTYNVSTTISSKVSEKSSKQVSSSIKTNPSSGGKLNIIGVGHRRDN